VLSELKVIDVDDKLSNPAEVLTAVEPVILMYPFLGEMDIKRVAKGLFSSIGNVSDSYVYHSQVQCTNPRGGFVSLLKEDVEMLNPKGWLNDKLIDFWLKWKTRFVESNGEGAVYAFSSYFYVTLMNKCVVRSHISSACQ
jgi:hypothetical protein